MSNTLDPIVMGGQIYIARFGTVVGENTVDNNFVPDKPDPTMAVPADSPWSSMGKTINVDPNYENKDIDIEGCDDQMGDDHEASYLTETITIQNKKNITFSSRYLSKEAFELSQERLFSGKVPYIDAWLYVRFIDTLSPAGEQGLSELVIRGRLKMATPAKANSDAAQADYQFDIMKNPLNDGDIDGVLARLAAQ